MSSPYFDWSEEIAGLNGINLSPINVTWATFFLTLKT